jgi:hypothetical protein
MSLYRIADVGSLRPVGSATGLAKGMSKIRQYLRVGVETRLVVGFSVRSYPEPLAADTLDVGDVGFRTHRSGPHPAVRVSNGCGRR